MRQSSFLPFYSTTALRQKSDYSVTFEASSYVRGYVEVKRNGLTIRGRARIISAMPRQKKKNAAAVALGRKGASKGGLARAASMTAEERSESARQAVAARWERYREQQKKKRRH
jgi:hypothetical protein